MNMIISLNNKQLLNIISITALIITFFITPNVLAEESENLVEKDIITTDRSYTNSEQEAYTLKDQIKSNNPSESSEVCISLNDKLKWFFSLNEPIFIEDLYEDQYDFNYRAIIGFHIAL